VTIGGKAEMIHKPFESYHGKKRRPLKRRKLGYYFNSSGKKKEADDTKLI